jgi:hypothetical protein
MLALLMYPRVLADYACANANIKTDNRILYFTVNCKPFNFDEIAVKKIFFSHALMKSVSLNSFVVVAKDRTSLATIAGFGH